MSNDNASLQQFWDVRFASPEFIYGKEPNEFFKSVIDTLTPGKLLVPGAGEGRDGVYAATKGWDVHCIDQSCEGRNKANALAQEKNVHIAFDVQDIEEANIEEASMDAIASVFFHLPSQVRGRFLYNAIKWLKPSGLLIIQSFTPRQLERTSGGPRDLDMLMEPTEIEQYSEWLIIERSIEKETELQEGDYHRGIANVTEIIARKK